MNCVLISRLETVDSFHVPHMRGLSIWKSVFVFKLDFVEAEGKLLYALSI
jgi:hypothetical protein